MPGSDSSIASAVESGLTSDAFDLSANVARGDERQVDPALEAIMQREECDFDTARNLYNRQKMSEAGIDPDTGLSLDPKAVTSTEDFERVSTSTGGAEVPAQGAPCGRALAKAAKTKAWWVRQCDIFGLSFVLFISVSNFLFGVLGEWYAIFLAAYLKDDLCMDAALAQAISTTAGLAYQLRPLCGTISDSYPLLGSTRHSWFFVTAMLAVVSQGLLLMATDQTVTTILLFLTNVFGGVWLFVISGAMVAEVARKDPKAGAETLQSIQWGFFSLGQLSGDFSAGPIYSAFGSARRCFALSMAVYFLLGFAPFSVHDHSASAGSPMARLQRVVNGMASSCLSICRYGRGRARVGDVDSARFEVEESGPVGVGNVRLTDETRDENHRVTASSVEADGSSKRGLLEQMRKIWRTVDPRGPTKGLLLRPALYIIFCVAVVPDYYYGATYYFYQSPTKQEATGCDGSLSRQITCTPASSVHLSQLRAPGGCAAAAAEERIFRGVAKLEHFRPAGGSTGVMRWEYTGGGPGACAACGDLAPDDEHPSLEQLCGNTSDCEMTTLYQGTGCTHGGTEPEETSSEHAEAAATASCLRTRACVRSIPNDCPTDEALEKLALQQLFGLGAATGGAPATASTVSRWLASLQPICQRGSWLPGCGNRTAAQATDGDGSSGASCGDDGGYGYGHGYGEGLPCAAIVHTQFFAVLSDSSHSGVCDLSICNVTTTDACTAVQGGLGFDYDYWSILQGLGSIGGLIGTFIYGAYLSGVSLRKSLAGVHIALAVVGGADAMLALRYNVDWGIDDKYFAGIDQFGYWFCYQCKMLPMYALATRICPPGLEATMIAVVLSLKDLGYSFASYYGAFLTESAGITPNECGLTPFASLYMLYLWRIVCRLMPAIFIMIIPTNEQINDAMAALAEDDQHRSRSSMADEGLGSSLSSGSSVGGGEHAVETTANPTARLSNEEGGLS
eukprot:SAG11_NODE_744_length_7406_cov_2.773231_1_plen_961_part_00